MSDTFNSVDPLVSSEAPPTAEELQKNKEAFFADLQTRFGPSAPTEKILDTWKSQTGRIRWLELGPDEIYFFRGCRTAEYKGWLQSLAELIRKDPNQAEEILKERVVCACVLFPKIDPENTGAMYGGTMDTLYFQIRLASNFIPPEQAMMMVREW